ncbi:MAG: nucleotidyltransferase domain-containing protein [Prevotella sp.]|nr:nucleotidyltransferase domain-containing protein [Prevotella sp.]
MLKQVMKQTLSDYFKTQPVLKAWLFGSFARDEETPLSDVDIIELPMLARGWNDRFRLSN